MLSCLSYRLSHTCSFPLFCPRRGRNCTVFVEVQSLDQLFKDETLMDNSAPTSSELSRWRASSQVSVQTTSFGMNKNPPYRVRSSSGSARLHGTDTTGRDLIHKDLKQPVYVRENSERYDNL